MQTASIESLKQKQLKKKMTRKQRQSIEHTRKSWFDI